MAKVRSTKISFKKTWEEKTAISLRDNLTDLKEILGEKKFEKKIKKVSRLLAPGKKYAPKEVQE